MQALQSYVRRHFYTLLMLFVAGGFAALLAELLMTDHLDGIQLVAPISCAVGLVLTLTALAMGTRARYALATLLLLLGVTGLIGAFEHFEESEEEAAIPAQFVATPERAQTVALRADEDEEGEGAVAGDAGEEEAAGTPPPLAPLSLTALAVLGATVQLGRDPEKA